jgi:PKHD-type hydroxylase
MILCVADLLAAPDLELLRRRLGAGRLVDGRRTAGWHARTVKNNQQLAPDDEDRVALARVAAAIEDNELVRAAALPRRILPPMLVRYGPEMSYGSHVDDAIMGRERPMRTDVSVTVFLDDPESYDGGALVIESTAGEQAFKLPAGSAVLYPATTLHRVEKVTRGARHVAVTWVQSLVRDPARREILFDLDQARRAVFEASGKNRQFDLIAKSYANLLRLWAEP